MSNKFEVTLVGNDQLGSLFDQTSEKVKALQEDTKKFESAFQGLTGKESQAGLSVMDQKFSSIAKSAKDNVQNIGDMVPPLKNFGELSGKYLGTLGKLGLAGGGMYAVGRAITGVSSGVAEMASQAYNLDVAAQSLGLSVEKLSMMTGAFQQVGIDKESSTASLSGVSNAFNNILRGDAAGNQLMSQLAAMGLDRSAIPTRKDSYGNEFVILDELLPVLDKLYDSISDPQTRSQFAQVTGLDSNMEALFRGDVSVQQRYNKAYELGFVRTEELNENLKELNSTVNNVSASMSGWWQRTKDSTASTLLGDGSVMDGLKGVGELFTHGDRASFAQAIGLNRGDDSERMRMMQADPEYQSFKKSFGFLDDIASTNGVLTNGMWDNFVNFKMSSNGNYQDPFAAKPFSVVQSEEERNLKAFLDFISMSEGTYGKGDDGYNVTFGGGTFNNGLAYHPNIQRSFMQTDGRMNSSGAAGRYQFINKTWGRLSNKLGLQDFSKESQDRAAIELIKERGAYNDVISSNWNSASQRLGVEWASLPSSPYPQNTHSQDTINRMYGQARQNQEPMRLEVKLTNTDTGHSRTVEVQSGGEVTTAMNY